VTLDEPGVSKISIPKGREPRALILGMPYSKSVQGCEASQEIFFIIILISLFSCYNPGKSEK
jgi:hypothetical protein